MVISIGNPLLINIPVKTLREKFGTLNIMKIVLSLNETPPLLERKIT